MNIASLWHLSTSSFLTFSTSITNFPAIANPLNTLGQSDYVINWQAVYLIGTLIIGLLIAYESIVLKKNLGKLPQSKLFNISSILESVWLMISIAALYYGQFNQLGKVVPIAYIIYSVFGWLYGFYLLKDQALDIKDVEDVSMPIKYMDYSLSFSLAITFTSIAIFINMMFRGLIAFSIA